MLLAFTSSLLDTTVEAKGFAITARIAVKLIKISETSGIRIHLLSNVFSICEESFNWVIVALIYFVARKLCIAIYTLEV